MKIEIAFYHDKLYFLFLTLVLPSSSSAEQAFAISALRRSESFDNIIVGQIG